LRKLDKLAKLLGFQRLMKKRGRPRKLKPTLVSSAASKPATTKATTEPAATATTTMATSVTATEAYDDPLKKAVEPFLEAQMEDIFGEGAEALNNKAQFKKRNVEVCNKNSSVVQSNSEQQSNLDKSEKIPEKSAYLEDSHLQEPMRPSQRHAEDERSSANSSPLLSHWDRDNNHH